MKKAYIEKFIIKILIFFEKREDKQGLTEREMRDNKTRYFLFSIFDKKFSGNISAYLKNFFFILSKV